MNKLIRDRTVLLALAALALGDALQVRDGLYSPIAITLLGCAFVLAFGALLYRAEDSGHADKVLVAAVLIQLLFLLGEFPGSHHEPHRWRDYWPFLALVALAMAMLALMLRWPRVSFGLLLLTYAVAGTWMLGMTRSPFMDVFIFQRDACAAMVNGTNPYTITFPNIYGPHSFVYDASLISGDRVRFGFPYMPATLWFNLLGHTTAPDYRFANLIAVGLAASAIASIGQSQHARLAALLLLFTPRGFFILEQGWTEPLMVLLLAATVMSAVHYRVALPFLLGLLLASKQYMVIAIPLVPLLADWRDWRFHLKAVATAVIVTLPLVLWDFRAFWDNAVLLQFRQPFRDDALSFAALLARHGFGRLPMFVPLVAATAVAVLCVRRLDRSAHSFALAFALTFLTFFALNKQAFANYYFLVIAALCCAIASFKQNEPLVR